MMEAIRSSETLVLTRTTRRNIPEDSILQGHLCEHLKSNKVRQFALSGEKGRDLSFIWNVKTVIHYLVRFSYRRLASLGDPLSDVLLLFDFFTVDILAYY
jgi:hypothetical protein